ncbi:MAG TPA: sigma-70 family RNA polymerase sigma factor [Acidobacteriota bacterium]|jgi:RNA polymerase sigma-70 factor (ECF subfamily)|nr:sigma-70 family RNA polymerase sigma factor [Acidobacteriota bacterium]HNT17119.1 sigma-70 family RNA polymerase sigma factor [Acidobacteriota bacterium]HQO19236.1 sigma-70 family RNA polymerase sigma factor [Acidobacteriota bacterium]HQQ46048.1 sigma-70 family RNA polymerase sigma factor [Acidobacteriota bacterium]
MNEERLKALLKKARKGDMEAFRELVEETRDRLFGALRAMLNRESVAEEILQEAYIALWEQPSSAGIEKPGAWLYRSCVNRAIDHIRQKDSRFTDALDDQPDHILTGEETPEISLETREQAEMLNEGLAALSARERTVFVLSAYLGYDSFEIGATLGVSPSTVRNQYASARKKLAAFLSGEGK